MTGVGTETRLTFFLGEGVTTQNSCSSSLPSSFSSSSSSVSPSSPNTLSPTSKAVSANLRANLLRVPSSFSLSFSSLSVSGQLLLARAGGKTLVSLHLLSSVARPFFSARERGARGGGMRKRLLEERVVGKGAEGGSGGDDMVGGRQEGILRELVRVGQGRSVRDQQECAPTCSAKLTRS